ncbi:hypothetical protein EU805_10725 [Salipiger sp. IMCC34102]|uniref:hypothetical protein n=1 Tax=Salipiger sp. IMCC34102 TaxID=2510647 RepID=UPI00101B9D7E|nr:hypothetical protein [Salipiger sp. IMCC34102]RYH02314.1 hypothetical protein EU805_10725 [Salipiger sp. IMCC34102]
MKLKDELSYVEAAAIQARALNFPGLAEAFELVAKTLRDELGERSTTEPRDRAETPSGVADGGEGPRGPRIGQTVAA